MILYASHISAMIENSFSVVPKQFDENIFGCLRQCHDNLLIKRHKSAR